MPPLVSDLLASAKLASRPRWPYWLCRSQWLCRLQWSRWTKQSRLSHWPSQSQQFREPLQQIFRVDWCIKFWGSRISFVQADCQVWLFQNILSLLRRLQNILWGSKGQQHHRHRQQQWHQWPNQQPCQTRRPQRPFQPYQLHRPHCPRWLRL